MARMSDILRKAKERKARREGRAVPPEPVKEKVAPEPEAYEEKKPEVERREAKPEIYKVRMPSIVRKEARVASSEETMKLYEELVSLMGEVLKEDIDYESIEAERITVQVEKLIDQLSWGNERMLGLALVKNSIDENYLPRHSVNVCIFSIEVGLGLGYGRARLVELGISALLHDMGMPKYLHLANQPRKLTAKEYNEIKNHPIGGSEILKKIKGLNKVAIYVARQHHERINGSGYPRGLKGESINEYAKIVSVVDVYEAMLHRRAYRNGHLSLETMQEILTNKKAFEYKLIKILIEEIGVFPLGSLVELDTKEIAEVIKLNRGVPLRPVVKIIYDADGKQPSETKVLDLVTQPTIYIKRERERRERGQRERGQT